MPGLGLDSGPPSLWPDPLPGDDESAWLRPTRLIDLADAKLRITAHKLTQARQSHAARAAAVQEFVRRMPFAASTDGGFRPASEVLREGRGDCHSKGVLFTALCRAAGLPARLLFVRVRTGFLGGILQERPASMAHAVGQVWVGGRWHSTDGYVVDPQLFARAKRLLQASGEEAGYGIVAHAISSWDGEGDCLHQFHPDDVLETYGAFHDTAHFYSSPQAERHRGWIGSLKYAMGARLVNHRVAQVRRVPVADAGGMPVRHG